MVVREIQMISNTYGSEKPGLNQVLGQYCVFGPFDAMDIAEETMPWNKHGAEECWEDLEKEIGTELSGYDGRNNRCKVSCFFSEDEEEQKFVDRLKQCPFLFVSFILLRHKYNKKEELRNVKAIIKDINANSNVRVYLSLGKNELILLHYCNSFTYGFNTVSGYHRKFDLSKSSTIFAVREQALDSPNSLYEQIDSEEKIRCRLRCIVKEYTAADAFIKKLYDFIMEKSKNQAKIRCYNMIGGNDILIEIDNFALADLLPLYKTKELLTHMNPDYSSAWFNIETELISEREGIVCEAG